MAAFAGVRRLTDRPSWGGPRLPGGELAAGEDQYDVFAAAGAAWGPVDVEEMAGFDVEAEFFIEFSAGAGAGGLVGLDGSAGDLPGLFVGGVDEQDALLFVEEEDAVGFALHGRARSYAAALEVMRAG
ncbi:hypothetical protein AB0C98_41990 [Streptomyces sp. NPDC048558]|uniref:hypothetical protein n=1 Tax=Streptomyces sp. NPDC048558 TaxID=3155759 RepID=UPI00341D02E3